MFKLFVVVMLLAVVGSLFSGLFFLFRDQGGGSRTVKALTLRVCLSILLFIMLMIGFRYGLLSR